MNDLIGRNLGRYHIVDSLGQGGMATVFKAYDTTLERYVAVKVIRTDMDELGEGEFIKRFKREATALAQLDHPYILKVLDYGEQDGIPYLVMPFVPGGTLKQKMGKPISYQEAASLLAPIARALEYAHKQKIIHRDVKPANILITEAGAPLLSDFGIAKMLSSSGSTQLTATGVGIGTPDYMAPEQWAGQVEPRTDIYSLGIVFYEMVTGHRPFTADTPAAVLIKHLRDPLPHPSVFVPDLPDPVIQVLFKALDKELDNRFQDMGLFAAALEKLAVYGPASASQLDIDLPTIQHPQVNLPSTSETVQHTDPLHPVKQGRQKDTRKIGFWIVAGVVGIGFICIVIGGMALTSFSALKNRNNSSPTSVAGATRSEEATQSGDLSVASTPTSDSVLFPQNDDPASTASPIQSIEGFPDDVPLLKDNNGDLIKSVVQGQVMYMFTTNLSFSEAADFYKTGLENNGWSLMSETIQQGQTMWYYTKGEGEQNTRMVMVGITEDSDLNTRQIMIYLMTQ